MLSEIHSPRQLRPANALRKDKRNVITSNEGVVVKKLNESERLEFNPMQVHFLHEIAHCKLNLQLGNRPTIETLKEKNIIVEVENQSDRESIFLTNLHH